MTGLLSLKRTVMAYTHVEGIPAAAEHLEVTGITFYSY